MSGTCNGHHYEYLGSTALPSVIGMAGEQTVYCIASSQASPPGERSEREEKQGRPGMAQSHAPSLMTFHVVVSCFTAHRPCQCH